MEEVEYMEVLLDNLEKGLSPTFERQIHKMKQKSTDSSCPLNTLPNTIDDREAFF